MITKKKGVTIIELTITLFVLFVGIVGILSISKDPINQIGDSAYKMRAYYYAKEAVEIVRNQRDGFIVREESWDKQTLETSTYYLNMNPISGTIFKRDLVLEQVAGYGDFIKVYVYISWTRKGKDYQISLQENIYKWW